MDLTVKLQAFEGPLDLLLHLLEKNKVNITDIPIVEITNQYMDYIRCMQRQDLNVCSEFLVMAATLLDIKSRMLLPAMQTDEEEESEDPRAALVQQLLEYKMYKYISAELKDRRLDAGKVLFKGPSIPQEVRSYEEPVDVDALVADLTLEKLHSIFHSMMKKQVDKIDPIRSKFGQIKKEELSLDECMSRLETYAKEHKCFSFRGLLSGSRSKNEMIVLFLAILELMKLGAISITQTAVFDDINITSQIAA